MKIRHYNRTSGLRGKITHWRSSWDSPKERMEPTTILEEVPRTVDKSLNDVFESDEIPPYIAKTVDSYMNTSTVLVLLTLR